jgi:hypothetical protein
MTTSRSTGQVTAPASSQSVVQTLLVAGVVSAAIVAVVFAVSATGVALAFTAGALSAMVVADRKRTAVRDPNDTDGSAGTPDRVAAAPPYARTG